MSENKKTILIVEDEVSLRDVLCFKLAKEGFAVIEAKNGDEGLKLALTHHPDLFALRPSAQFVRPLRPLEVQGVFRQEILCLWRQLAARRMRAFRLAAQDPARVACDQALQGSHISQRYSKVSSRLSSQGI